MHASKPERRIHVSLGRSGVVAAASAVLLCCIVLILGQRHLSRTASSSPPGPATQEAGFLLQAENARLQKELAHWRSAALALLNPGQAGQQAEALEADRSHLSIDLIDLLGPLNFYIGPSYDPLHCFPPHSVAYPNSTQQQRAATLQRLVGDLVDEMAAVRGVQPGEVDPRKPYYAQPVPPRRQGLGPLVTYPPEEAVAMKLLHRDRLFNEWRVRQVKVLARYMVFEGVRHLAITCGEPEAPLTLEELGNKQCYADIEPVEFASQFGFMPRPWTSPMHLARDALTRPVCTMLTWNHSTSWADWLQRERVGNPEWKTFHTKSYAEDTLILLFDLLYESRRTYTQQHWLGTIAMQNPFDMYSIQDIIFTVRPDIIIETGTANGGSALLWASIMELCDIQGGRVVTVDVNPPDWSVGRRSWGGIPRSNPVEHRLWKKRVTFIKGLSTAPEVVQQVVGLVANHTQVPGTGQAPGSGPGLQSKQAAAKVLVLLDSSHREEAVREEMDHYCQLVTAGSYCIVEDVKLSRWSSNGPLAAIRAFLAAHPDFRSDRQRELLYTHHASGYLLRAAP